MPRLNTRECVHFSTHVVKSRGQKNICGSTELQTRECLHFYRALVKPRLKFKKWGKVQKHKRNTYLEIRRNPCFVLSTESTGCVCPDLEFGERASPFAYDSISTMQIPKPQHTQKRHILYILYILYIYIYILHY